MFNIFFISTRSINQYLFDTFEGMTKPTTFDRNALTKDLAIKKFNRLKKENHNNWCYASLDDVKNSFMKYDLMDKAFFIKGDVNTTLNDLKNLPEKISLLRLDTDFYDSTKIELEKLYPLLSKNGILIIDDYGHWKGAKKAVDEYFEKINYKPFFLELSDLSPAAITSIWIC